MTYRCPIVPFSLRNTLRSITDTNSFPTLRRRPVEPGPKVNDSSMSSSEDTGILYEYKEILSDRNNK